METLQDNDFVQESSYKLIVNLGPLGRGIWLVCQSQLEQFINLYDRGGNIVFQNIDNELIGLDSNTIMFWNAHCLGRTELPFLQELGMYEV